MNHRLKAECERAKRAKRGGKAQKGHDDHGADRGAARDAANRPAPGTAKRAFPSEEELRRELADAIDRRRAADTRAKAAKVIADKAEALMCAAGEKVAYGGHRSRLSRACPLRPKSRRKGEARLGPNPEFIRS